MPLPPRGSPLRPLHLAVRSMRMLGIILLLISMMSILSMALVRMRSGGIIMLMMVSMLTYMIPGVLFLVFSVYLSRKRAWAIIGGLVLTSISLLVLLIGVVTTTYAVSQFGQSPAVLIAFAVFALFIAAFVQLIVHLSKSFNALRHTPVDQQRGFEPLPPVPVLPPISPEAEQT